MSAFARFLLTLDRAVAGLRQRNIQVDDHRIVYAEGGRGETVLLLHGFGSDESCWNRVAKFLTKRYHVVAPDLPGWGSSTRIATASYAYPDQVERVHRIVQELKLDRFHLVGHSMGGGIAARYAAQYPDEIITLGLIAAHGIIEPRESGLRHAVEERGENWLLVSSPQDFQNLLKHLFVKRPFVPRSVTKYLQQNAIAKCEQNRKIFEEILRNDPPLVNLLQQIKAPTLIIWGDQDLLVDVSAAEIFKAKIKRSQLLVIPNCGHMPILERPRECVEAYLAFLRKPI